MKIGILGGTFDPVHWGHLLLAETVREELSLDKIVFMPAFVPPHKQSRSITEGRHRVEMIRLAIAGHSDFEVSEWEIRQKDVCYTRDTLKMLKRDLYQKDDLFFILGEDNFRELNTWKEPETLFEYATVVVMRRSDSMAHTPVPEAFHRAVFVQTPLLDISSSEIRERVAAGKSIRFRVDKAVENYIEMHQLYRPQT